jgi:hypothetical protein
MCSGYAFEAIYIVLGIVLIATVLGVLIYHPGTQGRGADIAKRPELSKPAAANARLDLEMEFRCLDIS